MKVHKIITVCMFSIIISCSMLFIFTKKTYFSENEFRYLEKIQPINFNTIITRKTFANIDKYLEDHFPFRENLIKVKNNFELLIGKDEINGVYVTDEFYIEKYNGFERREEFVDILNEFYQNNLDVDMNLMLVPTSYQVYDEYLDKYYRDNKQMQDIEFVYDKLKFNKIELLKPFNKNKDKYQLYYKTDHHWTTYGAYLAYKEYALNKNMEVAPMQLKLVSDSFKGSIYSKVLLDRFIDDIYVYDIKDEVEVSYNDGKQVIKKDTLYNMDYLDKKDKYSLFLDNNNPLLLIENKNFNKDNNILVIKDSYANSFIPFLVNNYKYIHVIDMRYYMLKISDYIKENNIEEVLFLYNINTLNDDVGIYRLK